MKKFKFIETTADVGVLASGKSLKEVFTHTAQGLFSLMAHPDSVRKKKCVPFSSEGDSLENLLVNWLNELVYLLDTHTFLAKEIDIKEITHNKISGDLWGEEIDRKRHALGTEVKAATYHNLAIKKNRENWTIKVIFDV